MIAAAWFVGILAALIAAVYAVAAALWLWGAVLAHRDITEAEAHARFARVMDAHTRGPQR